MTAEPISRRSAIRTSGLAAIAAGLLSSAGTVKPAAAQPAPLTVTISLADGTPPVDAAWYAEWRKARDEASNAVTAAAIAIIDRLGDDGAQLVNTYEDAVTQVFTMESDLAIEKMAVHLPGLAGALRLLHQHIYEAGAYERVMGCCRTIGEG